MGSWEQKSDRKVVEFHVLLTVHLGSVLVNNQLHAQLFFSYIFIPVLYMFRAPLCSSSGESTVLIWHLLYDIYVGDRQVCRFGWNWAGVLETCRELEWIYTKKRIVRQVGYLKERNVVCVCVCIYIYIYIYTGCPRRKGENFGRVFLMLKYTDITQNTYSQSWTVTEILAKEFWNFDSCYTLIDYQIHIKTGRNMWFL